MLLLYSHFSHNASFQERCVACGATLSSLSTLSIITSLFQQVLDIFTNNTLFSITSLRCWPSILIELVSSLLYPLWLDSVTPLQDHRERWRSITFVTSGSHCNTAGTIPVPCPKLGSYLVGQSLGNPSFAVHLHGCPARLRGEDPLSSRCCAS